MIRNDYHFVTSIEKADFNDSERCIVYFVMLVKHDLVFKVVSENCNKTKEIKKESLYFIRILILRPSQRRASRYFTNIECKVTL